MILLKCIRHDLSMILKCFSDRSMYNRSIRHSKHYQLNHLRGLLMRNRTLSRVSSGISLKISSKIHLKNFSNFKHSSVNFPARNQSIVDLKDGLVSNESSKLHRFFSSKSKENKIQGNFRNCVLVSKSNDIFENLAIEDWLYKYQDFENNELLLIWYNRPSIVIGRHQNPWQEVNLDKCLKSNVSLARRNSGGGTVFHDEKNLNICFFTSKKAYNRRRNLEYVQSTVKTSFGIDLKINAKEDLVLDRTGEKVSGTASKLAYNKSYHHCTLLIDTNLNDLSKFIRKKSVSFPARTFLELFYNFLRTLFLQSLHTQ